jgi:hypothetical protein
MTLEDGEASLNKTFKRTMAIGTWGLRGRQSRVNLTLGTRQS